MLATYSREMNTDTVFGTGIFCHCDFLIILYCDSKCVACKTTAVFNATDVPRNSKFTL